MTQLAARLAEMPELGRDALLDSHVNVGRARLRFASDAAVRERVHRIVGAERECCSFLAFVVENDPSAVVITVDAPAGAEDVLAEWGRAFRASLPTP